MLVCLAIDYENTSRAWWDNGGRELWEGVAEAVDDSSVVVDESVATSWLAEAEQIDGWADGPDYAPHPIRLAEVDEDAPV